MRGARRVVATALAVSLTVVTAGCRQAAKGGSAAIPEIPVRTAVATCRDVPRTFETVGTVEAYNSVTVASRVAGQVLRRHFDEGRPVREGQLLFSIDPAPYQEALRQASARLATNRAREEFSRSEAERYAFLVARGAVSRSEHERHEADAEALATMVEADNAAVEKARLDLSYCEVRSPISGRAGAYLANEGATVEAYRTALVVVNQLDPAKVAFSVPEALLPQVRQVAAASGGTASVSATAPGGGGPAKTGRLSFIDNTVGSGTGMIRLKAEVDNTDGGFWPGQYVTVTLTLGVQRDAVVVPAAAIRSSQAGHFAFIVADSSTAERREVDLERWHDELAVIRSGIDAGETVVVDGQSKLKPGSRVRVLAGEHAGDDGISPPPGEAGAH